MNKQVVTVDYKKFEGLILKWNFLDLKRTSRFLRHFIIVGSTDLSSTAFLIEDYVRLMKPGDLYSVLFFNSNRKQRFKGWREKTYSTDFSVDNLLGDRGLKIPKWEEAFQTI